MNVKKYIESTNSYDKRFKIWVKEYDKYIELTKFPIMGWTIDWDFTSNSLYTYAARKVIKVIECAHENFPNTVNLLVR